MAREDNRGRDRRRRDDDNAEPELVDKLVQINRVAKTVKGGRNFQFAVLAVVGDQKGHIGLGHKCAKEVATSIRGGIISAKPCTHQTGTKRARDRRARTRRPLRFCCVQRLPRGGLITAVETSLGGNVG